MFRDLLSSRLIQAGLAFFVLVVGGSLLYSWHIHHTMHHTTEIQLAETQQVLKHHENQNAARTGPIDFATLGDLIPTSEETEASQTMAETTDAAIDGSESFDEFFAGALPADVESLPDEVNEEVLVSPNGFGPLPAVPEDYPNQEVWSEERLTRITPEHELLSRVRIELWNQGVRTHGAVYRTDYGRIYPTTDDVVYIQWDDKPAADGEIYVIGMLGTSATLNQYEEDIYRGIFPPHLTIYEFPDGGIDPYEFLGL